MKRTMCAAIALVCAAAVPAHAAMRITEWMYNGVGAGNIGEFVELTNLGGAPVDMTGWSFDDDSALPGTISLSAFGMVAPGQSVVLTDNTVAAFKSEWGLSAAAKVIGGNTANLGRNDTINIFDSSNALVDRLKYGDQDFAGTIRTNGKSGFPTSAAALGANNPALWTLAASGDANGSHLSTAGDLGNPGTFVPEPATLAMAGVVAVFGANARRRRG